MNLWVYAPKQGAETASFGDRLAVPLMRFTLFKESRKSLSKRHSKRHTGGTARVQEADVLHMIDGPQAPVFLSHPMAGNERLVSALRHLQLFVGGGHRPHPHDRDGSSRLAR